MATNNAINQKRPSGFTAYLSAPTANNVTGDATQYTVLYDTTIVTDGNYNTGTGIYTAPATGRYLVSGSVMFTNLGAGHINGQVLITSTGVTYIPWIINAYGASSSTQLTLPFCTVISLTAGDSLKVNCLAAGSTKTVGIIGSGSPYSSWFSCYLVG